MATGRVLTVASASGGCGKTFVATNLAVFLAQHGRRSVCLVDLDLRFGEVGSSLRLHPQATIADLVVPQDVDLDLEARLARISEPSHLGFSVLAAPTDPVDAGRVRPRDVRRVLDAARNHFDDVVVDTAPGFGDLQAAALEASDEVLVLATPDVPSLRNMRVLLGTLDRRRIARSRLRIVLNRTSAVDPAVHELMDDLGRRFDAVLPLDRAVERAAQLSRPVLSTDPVAPVARRLGEAFRPYLPDDEQMAYDLSSRSPTTRRHRPRRWWRHDQPAG